jgi:hypothetical protein
MANNTYLQTGQQIGQSLANIPWLQRVMQNMAAGAQPVQQGLDVLNNLLQGMGGMGTPLPKIAIDTANQVSKKYFKEKAEEALLTPGGAERLARIAEQSKQAPKSATPIMGQDFTSPLGPMQTAPLISPELGPINPPTESQLLSQALGGTDTIAEPKIPQRKFEENWMGETLMGLASVLGGRDLFTERLQRQKMRQEIEGKVPLQEGEREKIALQSLVDIRKELLKKENPDALKGENATKFSLLLSGKDATEQMANILEQNRNVLTIGNLPGFLKSQEGRQFSTSMKEAFGARLRIESGAKIGQEEIDDAWKKYAPTPRDSDETIRRKFMFLYNFFTRSINVADPTGIHRQRASSVMGGKDLRVVSIKEKARGM